MDKTYLCIFTIWKCPVSVKFNYNSSERESTLSFMGDSCTAYFTPAPLTVSYDIARLSDILAILNFFDGMHSILAVALLKELEVIILTSELCLNWPFKN